MGTKPTDAALLAAQRDFDDTTEPDVGLKPGEQPCAACWLVHPGECF